MEFLKFVTFLALSVCASIYVMGKIASRHSTRQRKPPPAHQTVRWEDIFVSWFAFSPHRLNETRFQKEAYLKLAFLAKKVANSATRLNRYIYNAGLREEYNDSLCEFTNALSCLEHFAPQLASEVPHWTELPAFLNLWLAGNPVETAPRAKEIDPKVVAHA